MPYISQERREKIKPHLEKFWADCPLAEPGEMNYVLTMLLEYYRGGKYRYSLFNEIIGILTCVLQEYYRRMLSSYEDTKMEENGDVYHW